MTTVAWDGVSLAADRMAVGNGSKWPCTKVFRCGKWVYGATGSLARGILVSEWLRNGADRTQAPVFEKNDDDTDALGIAVNVQTRQAFLLECRPWAFLPIEGDSFASGSGRDAARAAMLCGKTAKQAVLIAGEIDIGTGFGVDVIRIRRKR